MIGGLGSLAGAFHSLCQCNVHRSAKATVSACPSLNYDIDTAIVAIDAYRRWSRARWRGAGFLPLASHPIMEGDTWTRERSLSRPVPLFIQNHCSLSRLTDRIADIDIAGTIATTRTFGEQRQTENGDVQVIVRGGHAHGTCRIDRETGLPLHCSVKHLLDMAVRQADGREFVQQKITTTTIRLFPEQSTPNSNAIQPASYEEVDRSASRR